ncbi:hypothetical protein M0811_03054 [Anaeramoeba ignava]|uniref:Uncharacterized protein n=1 Tax=Anaeramoeba ignava TaxID=1746090 RepID=A0A9Q0L8Q9_ANAIG|nr:hypothetical protein M0811_03054 [Anaeramoeba ignava]
MMIIFFRNSVGDHTWILNIYLMKIFPIIIFIIGYSNSFIYYSPSFSNLEEDFDKIILEEKNFCNISFKQKMEK